MLPVCVNGTHNVMALWDSGAETTVMDQDFASSCGFDIQDVSGLGVTLTPFTRNAPSVQLTRVATVLLQLGKYSKSLSVHLDHLAGGEQLLVGRDVQEAFRISTVVPA